MVTVTMVNKFKTKYIKKWMKIPEMEILEIKLHFLKKKKKTLDRQDSQMNMLDGKVNDLEKIELEIVQGKKIEQIFLKSK